MTSRTPSAEAPAPRTRRPTSLAAGASPAASLEAGAEAASLTASHVVGRRARGRAAARQDRG